MKNKKLSAMFVTFFIFIALAGIASAEIVKISYVHPAKGLVYNTTTSTSLADIKLPATNLNVNIENIESSFKVTIPNLNVSNVTVLDINVTDVDESTVTDSGIGFGTSELVRNAYAFKIVEALDKNYTITFNYSNSGVGTPSRLSIYKIEYNFTTNSANYSDYVKLTPALDLNAKTASVEVNNFSLFVLSEAKVVSRGGGGSGGGSGGSSSYVGKTITINPTPEGLSYEIKKKQKFNLMFNNIPYPYTLSVLMPIGVSLKDAFNTNLGITSWTPAKIDLDNDGRKDVEILFSSAGYSSAKLTFKLLTYEPTKPSLPIKEGTNLTEVNIKVPTAPELTPQKQPKPVVPKPTPKPEVKEPVVQPEVQTPSGGFPIWTIIFILVAITVLIGGIAVFHQRNLSLDKPPTAEVAGKGISEMPPTTSVQASPVTASSTEAEPASSTIATTGVEEPTKEKLTDDSGVIVQPEPRADEKKPFRPAYKHKFELKKGYLTPAERVKELEKYVYHGLAYGFTEQQLAEALVAKGWPDSLVEEVFAHIGYVDLHIADEKLHIQDIAIEHAVAAVHRLLKKGMTEEQLTQGLLRKGWKKTSIDKIMKEVKKEVL